MDKKEKQSGEFGEDSVEESQRHLSRWEVSKERDVLTFVYSSRGQFRPLKTVLRDFTGPTGKVLRAGTALHAAGALTSQVWAPQREAWPECATQTRPHTVPAVATSYQRDGDSGQNERVLSSGETAFLPGMPVPLLSHLLRPGATSRQRVMRK